MALSAFRLMASQLAAWQMVQQKGSTHWPGIVWNRAAEKGRE
jgi:hypothetical protein